MRSSFYVVGVAAAAIVGAGIIGFGCSSSSSPPTNNPPEDSGAGTDAAACIPLADASVATGDFSPIWTCLEQACSTSLTACAANCECNNAVLTALNCVATDAGTQTACFTNALTPIALTVVPAGQVGVCLPNMGAACGAMVVTDAGTDGSTDGGAKEDAASDAATTDAATNDAATDAGDSAAP
jgi:hypothetical protein